MSPIQNRILIVDDRPVQTRALIEALRANGNEVDEANSLEMARELISHHNYQLFVLDREILTPTGQQDGLELCREIRDMAIPARIVFFTNLMTPADHRQGWEAGADDYIEKSWSSEIAIARCEAHLGRKQKPPSVGSAKRHVHQQLDRTKHLVVDEASLTVSRAENFQLLRQGAIAKHRFNHDERDLYKKTKMTDLDLAVFFYLYTHKDHWISEEELLKEVWAYSDLRINQMIEDPDSNSGLVHTTISRIRRKVDSRLERTAQSSGAGNRRPWAYIETNGTDEQDRVRYRFNALGTEIADFPIEPII